MDDPWPRSLAHDPPEVRDADPFEADGCAAVFLDGPPWRGRATRIFAWYAIPAEPGPHPAVILLHGGTGTAFAEWVRIWAERGYAAIAPDCCGCVPVRATDGGWRRHPDGGPPGWGGFDHIAEPAGDQWMYHAVAAGLRCHAFLAARAEVDPTRVAATGISWGAVVLAHLVAIDGDLRCAVPVYGCGFLDGSPRIGPRIAACADPDRWRGWWDPAVRLADARVPLLWVNGTNDGHFAPPIWQRSADAAPGTVHCSLQPDLGHDHEEGRRPPEIAAFVAHHCCGGPDLPRCDGTHPVRWWWTDDDGPWPDRRWQALAADAGEADLPERWTAAYPIATGAPGLRTSGTLRLRDRSYGAPIP